MNYKLTLTNEIGEVIEYWHVRNEDTEKHDMGIERPEFNLEDVEGKVDLIEEITEAVSRAEIADQEQEQEAYKDEFWKAVNEQTDEFKKK